MTVQASAWVQLILPARLSHEAAVSDTIEESQERLRSQGEALVREIMRQFPQVCGPTVKVGEITIGMEK